MPGVRGPETRVSMCNYDVSTNTPAPCSSKVDSTRAPEVEAYLYPEKGWDMRRLLQDHQNGRETLFQPGVRSLEARVRTTLETASEKRQCTQTIAQTIRRIMAVTLQDEQLVHASSGPTLSTEEDKHSHTRGYRTVGVCPTEDASGRRHAANSCPKLTSQMKVQSIPP